MIPELSDGAVLVGALAEDLPQLTIITVARNNLNGLRQTFQSVQAQRGGRFEWLVIDGASTDGSVDFLRSLAFPALRWISEPDSGIYDAMNKGVARSRGSWIQFLNAGDIFYDSSHAVEKALDATNCARKTLLKFGYEYAGMFHYEDVGIRQLYRQMPNHQSIIYRASEFSRYGYDPKMRFAGDYRHFLEIGGWKKVETVGYTLIRYEGGGVAEARTNLSKIWAERARAVWVAKTLGIHKLPMWCLASVLSLVRRVYYS